jgi:hypothetical protein
MTKRQRSGHKQPHWLVPLLVGALLTATITTSVLEEAWNVVKTPFANGPSTQERIVKQFVTEVDRGGIWVSQPVTFSVSSTYFLEHFSGLDPRVTHTFAATPDLVLLGEVVERAPEIAGVFILTYGRVLTSNVVTNEPDVQDTLLQVVESSVRTPTPTQIGKVVYCRVPLSFDTRYYPGEPVFIEGIVVGAGDIQFNDGGYRPAAYMACAAIARPWGKCGRGNVPPVPGVLGCQPYPRAARKAKKWR